MTKAKVRSSTAMAGTTEFSALAKIGRLLSELRDEERSRVVRYVAEKYETDLAE